MPEENEITLYCNECGMRRPKDKMIPFNEDGSIFPPYDAYYCEDCGVPEDLD